MKAAGEPFSRPVRPAIAVLCVLLASPWARAEAQRAGDENQVQLDELVKACISSQSQDEVCRTLVQIQQIGNDAVEAIKTFVHLGPFEYAVLTAANFALTQRLRIRTRPLLFKDMQNTLDYNKGTVTLIFEREF